MSFELGNSEQMQELQREVVIASVVQDAATIDTVSRIGSAGNVLYAQAAELMDASLLRNGVIASESSPPFRAATFELLRAHVLNTGSPEAQRDIKLGALMRSLAFNFDEPGWQIAINETFPGGHEPLDKFIDLVMKFLEEHNENWAKYREHFLAGFERVREAEAQYDGFVMPVQSAFGVTLGISLGYIAADRPEKTLPIREESFIADCLHVPWIPLLSEVADAREAAGLP